MQSSGIKARRSWYLPRERTEPVNHFVVAFRLVCLTRTISWFTTGRHEAKARDLHLRSCFPRINGSLFDPKFDIMSSPCQAKSQIMATKRVRSDMLEPYLLARIWSKCMKRVGRGRTTDNRDGKTKDIVASTAGKPTRSWMVYRIRSIKRNRVARLLNHHSTCTGETVAFSWSWSPTLQRNQTRSSLLPSRGREEGVSRAMTSYERRAYNNKITTSKCCRSASVRTASRLIPPTSSLTMVPDWRLIWGFFGPNWNKVKKGLATGYLPRHETIQERRSPSFFCVIIHGRKSCGSRFHLQTSLSRPEKKAINICICFEAKTSSRDNQSRAIVGSLATQNGRSEPANSNL